MFFQWAQLKHAIPARWKKKKKKKKTIIEYSDDIGDDVFYMRR